MEAKISCCLETSLFYPCPAAWRVKLVASTSSRVRRKSGFSWQMGEIICDYGKCCFHPFHLLVTVVKSKPSVSEVCKISVFIFPSSISVTTEAHPGAAKFIFCLHSWQEYFAFSWLYYLELAFHTSVSQVLEQLFKTVSSNVASIQSWMSGLLDCTG